VNAIFFINLQNQCDMKCKAMSLGLVLGLFLTLVACGGKQEPQQGADTGEMKEMPAAGDESGPEYTSAYICPMHCPGSGSAEPGKCPACGMDYVKNDKASASEPGHEGHNH
jgi:hypothetical protein